MRSTWKISTIAVVRNNLRNIQNEHLLFVCQTLIGQTHEFKAMSYFFVIRPLIQLSNFNCNVSQKISICFARGQCTELKKQNKFRPSTNYHETLYFPHVLGGCEFTTLLHYTYRAGMFLGNLPKSFIVSVILTK